MFSVVQGLSEYPKLQECKIDGMVFQLHYSVTVVALLAFFVISTTRQFVGDPIDCVYDKNTIPPNVMNTFCWTHTTYTVPFTDNNSVTGHPGVGPATDSSTFRYHTYYQWVYFVLLLQAAMFYAPRWLWLQWEGGKVKTLMEGLRIAVISREEKAEKVEIILEYILDTWKKHDWYARRYIICEAIAISNVVAQFVLLGLFFEYNYLLLGFKEIIHAWKQVGVSPLYQLFPRVTMCKFEMFGQTAVVEVVAALCIMPLNIVNEKVYIFLWFWFMGLLLLSIVSLAVSIFVVCLPNIRSHILHHSFSFVEADCVDVIVKKGGSGDWFLLYLLGRNMDFIVYKEVMEKLHGRLTNKESEKVEPTAKSEKEEPTTKSEKETRTTKSESRLSV